MRQKLIVYALLIVVVIAQGVALSLYLNRDRPKAILAPIHTPRPTSTHFSEPLTEIVEIVETEESQPENRFEDTNCAYPLKYWQYYPDSWPRKIRIGGRAYYHEDVSRIFNDPKPDTAILLIRQLYTAFLNILVGTSHAHIDHIILDANNWLLDNPSGTAVSELNQEIGMTLAAELERYNNGLNGPPACAYVPPPPTPLPTATVTLTPTQTVRPVQTNRRAQPTATWSLSDLFNPSPTFTRMPPTATNTRTSTARPTKSTTLVSTSTATTLPPTSTYTPIPPTSTDTPGGPTNTATDIPPDNTDTPIPPTPTITILPTRNPHYQSPTPTEQP